MNNIKEDWSKVNKLLIKYYGDKPIKELWILLKKDLQLKSQLKVKYPIDQKQLDCIENILNLWIVERSFFSGWNRTTLKGLN